MKQEIEYALDLLEQYFEQASPDDDAGNIRIIKNLAGVKFPEISGTLLMLAPDFIVGILRQLVQAQTARLMFMGGDENEMDFTLRAAGLEMVMEYAHLIQAAGSGGVMTVITMLPWLAREKQDDAIAILALSLTFLLRDQDSLTQLALESVLESAYLHLIYDQTYNTSARIALAYLLFECGQRNLFQQEAVTMLATGAERRQLESLLTPGNLQLQAWVTGAILLEIASEGKAIPKEKGWRRRL